jgi:hypothetical protein
VDQRADAACPRLLGEEPRLDDTLDPHAQRVGVPAQDVPADQPRDVVVVERIAAIDGDVRLRAERLPRGSRRRAAPRRPSRPCSR